MDDLFYRLDTDSGGTLDLAEIKKAMHVFKVRLEQGALCNDALPMCLPCASHVPPMCLPFAR